MPNTNTPEYNHKYYHHNRLKIAVRRSNERAIAAGVESTLTVEEWIKILDKHNHQCAICGEGGPKSRLRLYLDHKVPFSKGGTNTRANTQPACHKCFSVKAASLATKANMVRRHEKREEAVRSIARAYRPNLDKEGDM